MKGDEVGEVERSKSEDDVSIMRVSSLASIGLGTHRPPPDALQRKEERHRGYVDSSPRGRGFESARVAAVSLSFSEGLGNAA